MVFVNRRVHASIIRVVGIIKKRSGNNQKFFEPLKIINKHKNPKGILSVSLFGDENSQIFKEKYLYTLLENAKMLDNIFPGWVIRVYLPSTFSKNIRNKLINYDCELYIMKYDTKEPFLPYLWRFLVASESVPFLVYDADMLITEKTYSVPSLDTAHEWLKDKNKKFFRRKFFIINDAWVLSAGMWGGKPDNEGSQVIPDIKERLTKYHYDTFGTDEVFLSKEIWPLFLKEGFYDAKSYTEKMLIIILLIVGIIIIFYKIMLFFRKK